METLAIEWSSPASFSPPIVLQGEIVSVVEVDTPSLVVLSPCPSLVAAIIRIRSRSPRPPLSTDFFELTLTFLSTDFFEHALTFLASFLSFRQYGQF